MAASTTAIHSCMLCWEAGGGGRGEEYFEYWMHMYMYGQNVTVHIANYLSKYILYIPSHSPAHVTNINCAHIELSLKYNYTSLNDIHSPGKGCSYSLWSSL